MSRSRVVVWQGGSGVTTDDGDSTDSSGGLGPATAPAVCECYAHAVVSDVGRG